MRCRSVGFPARSKSSTDCSVGVTESFAECSSNSGRGAILLTTSFALKLHDRARREVAAQARRDGNDVVARHAHRFSGALAAPSLLHHGGELLPGPGRSVLPAEFLRAVAPAPRGDAGGDSPVDPRSVYGDRRAETLPDHADTLGVDIRALDEERQRVPSVPDLLLANDPPALAFAFAAAAEVEAQRSVAQPGEHLGDGRAAAAVLIAAESVQDEKGGAPFLRSPRIGQVKDTCELQSVGCKADPFFHSSDPSLRAG